jgi:hypothetical protein
LSLILHKHFSKVGSGGGREDRRRARGGGRRRARGGGRRRKEEKGGGRRRKEEEGGGKRRKEERSCTFSLSSSNVALSLILHKHFSKVGSISCSLRLTKLAIMVGRSP